MGKKQQENAEDAIKESEKIIKKARAEGGADAGKKIDTAKGSDEPIEDIDTIVKARVKRKSKDRPEKSFEEKLSDIKKRQDIRDSKVMSTGEKLGKMLESYADNKDKPKQVADFEQRMLKRLYEKYMETRTKTPGAKQPSIYQVFGEMVLNRKKYAEVWNEAKDILGSHRDVAWQSDLADFMEMASDPVFSSRMIASLVNGAIKDMPISVTELAKKFFNNPTATMKGFSEFLQKKLAKDGYNVSADDLKYITDQVMPELSNVLIEYRELTPSEKLAKWVEKRADHEAKDPKKKDFNDRLLATLKSKFAEKSPLTKSAVQKMSVYDVVAEIAQNHEKYAEVWSEAQTILNEVKDVSWKPMVADFVDMLADPVMAEKVITKLEYRFLIWPRSISTIQIQPYPGLLSICLRQWNQMATSYPLRRLAT
jgi:hypothetical protein